MLVYDNKFSKDVKRGTYQVNFGYVSGQSCEKHNPASDRAHYRVSLPVLLLVGTKDLLDLMAQVTDFCKLVGVDWSNALNSYHGSVGLLH